MTAGRRCALASGLITLVGVGVGSAIAVAQPLGRTAPTVTGFSVRGELRAVAAASARNVWAVGTAGGQTLIVHWNGTRWHVQPSPRTPGGAALSGVSVVTAHDVWAVGAATRGTALIMHWNGTRWARQRAAAAPAGASLSAVAAVSARNAWAVGTAGSATLIEHWNGRSWKRVGAPSPGPYASLAGVAAATADNAWAVGTRFTTANEGKTLILHWNGSTWTSRRSPSPSGNAAGLNAVSADPGPAWSVGCSGCGIGGFAQSLIVRATSSGWVKVRTPRSTLGDLFAVAGLPGHSAWAVGGRYARPGDSQSVRTLAERWNGTTWAVVPTPSPGAEAALRGIAALSGGNAWAVGALQQSPGNASSSRTLILHWNGSRWR